MRMDAGRIGRSARLEKSRGGGGDRGDIGGPQTRNTASLQRPCVTLRRVHAPSPAALENH